MKNKKKFLLFIIFIVTIIIIANFKMFSETAGQINDLDKINIIYSSEENSEFMLTVNPKKEIRAYLLQDYGVGETASWEHSNIVGTYIDEGGNNVTENYEAAFAGWKLVSINGESVSGEYIYPDNEYIYMDDEPFVSKGKITSLKFEAVWGKNVYVRDKYNFVDIKNVYGYNVENSNGDILTAKINWDTSTIYGCNTNSGADMDHPVETIDKAYELLNNSYGGKINIVNHITLEAPETGGYQAYDSSFDNSDKTYTFEFGYNTNISGTVTISGKNLGLGNSIENKVNDGNNYLNSYMYFKNTRGAGVYNGNTYSNLSLRLRFNKDTILENLLVTSYRECFNIKGARSTSDFCFFGTNNHHLIIENSFKILKRETTQEFLGLDSGNWSYSVVQANVNGTQKNFSGFSNIKSIIIYGSRHNENDNDNIYLNVKVNKCREIYGVDASDNNIKLNNIHLNLENVSSTFYGIANGNADINKLNIYVYNSNLLTLSTTRDCKLNANEINIIVDGTKQSNVITNLYGGGYFSSTNGSMKKIIGDLNIKVLNTSIVNLYGGGNQVATILLGNINIDINGGSIKNLYGGGLGGYVGNTENKTNININVNGGSIQNLYGGGKGGLTSLYENGSPTNLSGNTKQGQYFYTSGSCVYATTSERLVTNPNDDVMFRIKSYVVKDGNIRICSYDSIYFYDLYPLGEDDNISNYYRRISEYCISDALVNGDITINLNKGASITENVYGGGENGAVTGNIVINVFSGAKVTGNIFGGGKGVNSNIDEILYIMNFRFTNSTADYVFDRTKYLEIVNRPDTKYSLRPNQNAADFLILEEVKNLCKHSDEYVYIYSETINQLGLITGNTNINMLGGTVMQNVYGGSDGIVANINGNTNIVINDANISNVYGGGNAGNVDGSASVTINSGTINEIYGGGYSGNIGQNTVINVKQGVFENIFGGGNLGVVGNTAVYIGDIYDKGITVNGIVYGGGRGVATNGDASEFVTVHGNSTVVIQGINTQINNYGSLKLGKVDGIINVTFYEYWTGNSTSPYKTMNGIDKATNVNFVKSYVLLENQAEGGTLEGIKSIGNLSIPVGSGLKISANGTISGDFEGRRRVVFR